MKLWAPLAFWGPRCSVPPVKMSAVVFPAAIAHFTSTQVIFSNSTWSVRGQGKVCAACAWSDPHPLKISRFPRHRLQSAATDRFTVQPNEQERAARRCEFVERWHKAELGIEPAFEPLLQFLVVSTETIFGVGAYRSLRRDRDRFGHRLTLSRGCVG